MITPLALSHTLKFSSVNGVEIGRITLSQDVETINNEGEINTFTKGTSVIVGEGARYIGDRYATMTISDPTVRIDCDTYLANIGSSNRDDYELRMNDCKNGYVSPKDAEPIYQELGYSKFNGRWMPI